MIPLNKTILLISSVLSISILVESGQPIKLQLYGQTIDGCGFMGMPCEQYFTNINMGNGITQQLRVTFDTYFNDLFVPLKGNGMTPLHYTNGFDVSRSQYYKDDWIDYEFSNLSGRWYSDWMSLSANQYFAMTLFVAQTSSLNFGPAAWDGVIGLGPKIASRAGTANILSSLKQQGLTDLLQFSLWFNNGDAWNPQQRAEVTLGGMDPSRTVNMQVFQYQNYDQAGFWCVPMSLFLINNQIFGCDDQDRCKAIIHSGISDIYGPRRQVNHLYRLFGIDHTRHSTYIDCQNLVRDVLIGFEFEGTVRYLSTKQFIRTIGSGRDQRCYIPIYPNEFADIWVLGTTFLSAYYTAVDVSHGRVLMSN